MSLPDVQIPSPLKSPVCWLFSSRSELQWGHQVSAVNFILLWHKQGTTVKACLMPHGKSEDGVWLSICFFPFFLRLGRYISETWRLCLYRLSWPGGCLGLIVDVGRNFYLVIDEFFNHLSFVSNMQNSLVVAWSVCRKHPGSCANTIKWEVVLLIYLNFLPGLVFHRKV